MTSHTGGRALRRARAAVERDEELELCGRGRDQGHEEEKDEQEAVEAEQHGRSVAGVRRERLPGCAQRMIVRPVAAAAWSTLPRLVRSVKPAARIFSMAMFARLPLRQ